MKLFLTALFMMAPSFGKAAITSIQDYGTVACGFYEKDKLLQKFEAGLITILVDDHYARFRQVRIVVNGLQVQYQILIEETKTTAQDGQIQLLQNLMINDKETTLDEPAKDLSQIGTQNGDYQVKCLIKK